MTWHQDVAPILAKHCQECHSPGNIGPFDLTTYEEAAPVADLLKLVTESRRMPPSEVDASGECNTYTNARWLSDDEIATLGAWADGGALEGDVVDAPGRVAYPSLARVDATLDIGVDFVPTDFPDQYRCFVVDPQLASDQYLTAFEVRPGNKEIVHHVILYSLPTAEAQARAEALDAEDAVAGYPCFGDSRVSNSQPLAAWAPGTPPTVFPDGTGIPMAAGRKAVLQMHYYVPGGDPAPDRTALDLTLESSVARPALNVLVPNTDIVLPPGEADWEQTVTANLGEMGLPVTVEVLGVFPHMHRLGKRLSFTVERADGTNECMTSVPKWDFNWQQFSFFEEPFELGPTDNVTMSCTFDTTDQTDTIYWGDGTEDEMCLLGMYVARAQ